jgi:hypothetical protein
MKPRHSGSEWRRLAVDKLHSHWRDLQPFEVI